MVVNAGVVDQTDEGSVPSGTECYDEIAGVTTMLVDVHRVGLITLFEISVDVDLHRIIGPVRLESNCDNYVVPIAVIDNGARVETRQGADAVRSNHDDA